MLLSDIEKKVLEEYRKEYVELNALFFDFEVVAKPTGLLSVYAYLQKTINNDDVVKVKNPVLSEDGEYIVGGEIIPLEVSDNAPYVGVMKTFLESYNNNDQSIFRIMDMEEEDGKITGGKILDFII